MISWLCYNRLMYKSKLYRKNNIASESDLSCYGNEQVVIVNDMKITPL